MKDTAGRRSLSLVTLAVGDAYGAGFEFEPPDVVRRENDGAHYRENAGNGAKAGRYTDDTQMSIALAEARISGEEWTADTLADHFVEVYRRDPRPGYARGFESVLKQCRNGRDLRRLIRPNSDRNGAAMRALPVGTFPTIAAVLDASAIQAKITHDTPGGIASASAAALMAHYCLFRVGPLAKLPAFLTANVPGYPWATPWRGEVPLQGVATVRAALTALIAHRNLADLLRASIAFTGDTDSVAAIALGAASCSAEYRQNLAPALHRNLENGAYGRRFLAALSQKLSAVRK